MDFRVSHLWLPKDINFDAEYEDAYAFDEAKGVIAIADGVSSAIFSRQWAKLLTDAAVNDPPEPNLAALQQWLVQPRADWLNTIDFSKLDFFRKMKLQQVGGGFSTLLWLQVSAPEADNGLYKGTAHAIGDCCLFHLRSDKLLRSFPIVDCAAFGLDPVSVCSVNQGRDDSLQVESIEFSCEPEDVIVLTSDALALWALQQYQRDEHPAWNEFVGMSPAAWAESIEELRNSGELRRDDTTMLWVQIGAATSTDGTVADAASPDSIVAEPARIKAD